MIVDSHCHLNYPEFEDLDKFVKDAKSNGIEYMQTICTKLEEFPEILEIANKYSNIWCSVGVHPNNVEIIPSTEELIKLSEHKKVIGLGETGLDYYYEYSKRDLQKESFINHIQASQENKLPVIIHSRDADEDTVKILQQQKKIKDFPALIHCFSTTEVLSDAAIEMGLYISISGIITFKNAQNLRDIVKNISLDNLLVETDSPYLAPIPFRGKKNQPSYTKYVVEEIAKIKDISPNEVAQKTTENFFKLFSKAK